MAEFHFDNSYRRLPQDLFAEVGPTPVGAPAILLYNSALAAKLGLSELSREEARDYFSGNRLPPGSEPLAQAYAGHQFGHPTMLGDGRAVLLGEQLAPDGKRYDIQLKGSGPTSFSRGGDGRAALGPMLREYLIGESLYALGVPTSRSLAVVTSGEAVMREQPLPGAIVTRVAASHLRVGTFQYAAWHSNRELLPSLFAYTLKRHYPSLKDEANPALALLQKVMERQIALLVEWMRVGFIHGVLNTDNVTLSGEAIDFGPCAFMDDYDPATVFSSIDRGGRYAFANQVPVTHWNLERLAETLLPLIADDTQQAIAIASELLDGFKPRFDAAWEAMMRRKLGLVGEQDGDSELIADWLLLLQRHGLDYTNAHRDLMRDDLPQQTAYQQPAFLAWWQKWRQRLQADKVESAALMATANPAVIARNHQVEKALTAAAEGDMGHFKRLSEVLTAPYEPRGLDDEWCQPPQEGERVAATFCGT